ncbi:17523_t:CDS:10 [Funneliformis geosporum]|nr:17523_t:CDS:10 [Funneliformis geosporum]
MNRKVEIYRVKTLETEKQIENLEKRGLIRNRYAGAYECNACHQTMFVYYSIFYDAVNNWRSKHQNTCSQHEIYEGIREMIKKMPTEYLTQKNIEFEGHYKGNKECGIKIIGANRGFFSDSFDRTGIHPDCMKKRSEDTGWNKVEFKCKQSDCEETTFFVKNGKYICYGCKNPFTPIYPSNFKGNKNGSDGFTDLIVKGLRPTIYWHDNEGYYRNENPSDIYHRMPFLTIAEGLLRLLKEDKIEKLIFLSTSDDRKIEVFEETFRKLAKPTGNFMAYVPDFDIFIDDDPKNCRDVLNEFISFGLCRACRKDKKKNCVKCPSETTAVLAPYYPILERKHDKRVLFIKNEVSNLKKEDFDNGKTGLLIERFNQSKNYRRCLAFKPTLDNRYSETEIVSHDKKSIKAIPIQTIREMEKYKDQFDNAYIDEIHFFSREDKEGGEVNRYLNELANQDKEITVAGLTWDCFADKPFLSVAHLVAMAEYPIRLFGKSEDFVGGAEKYGSYCRFHYTPPIGVKLDKVLGDNFAERAKNITSKCVFCNCESQTIEFIRVNKYSFCKKCSKLFTLFKELERRKQLGDEVGFISQCNKAESNLSDVDGVVASLVGVGSSIRPLLETEKNSAQGELIERADGKWFHPTYSCSLGTRLEDRVEIVIATKQSQTDSMVEDPTFFRKTKELWVICKHCKSPLNNYSPLKELPLDVDGIERNVGEHYQTSKGCREIIGLRKETEGEGSKSVAFFSVLVINPTGSLTTLRCVARGQVMNDLDSLENDDLVEVKGYIRNEKESRGILTKVTKITKLEPGAKPDNCLRLIGKIISDLELRKDNDRSKLTFRLVVPREERQLEENKRTDHSSIFYCKSQDDLATEFSKQLKKVQGFTLLDTDETLTFYPIDKLNRVFREPKKIDYTKPKSTTNEQ